MARIELPKDAEGREIPLDTEVLYDDDGTKVSVKEFLFRTLVESQKTEWTIEAQYEGNMYYNSFKPKNMRITQPDSWEKLEEDLDRCIKADSLCAYSPSEECSTCVLPRDSQCNCDSFALEAIKERIRKLRGEDK